ncbi:MFS transporter [Rhodoglobus aureus]|uniref:MFS transporter n=1 Tax=Rhodoglobus aureus TaxID=191497 RepID=UPI0031D92986
MTEIVRSIIFFGISTFIALYWIGHLGAKEETAGATLTFFLAGSVVGTLLGGRIGDRIGAVRTVQVGSIMAVPALAALRLSPSPAVGLVFAAVVGVMINVPFAVLIKLGQDYLPSRPGTTLGLAVSIGGLFTPTFGVIADEYGTQAVFTVLCFIPIAAFAISLFLSDPGRALTLQEDTK